MCKTERNYIKRIKRLILKGGPSRDDYPALKKAIDEISHLSKNDEASLMEWLTPVLCIDTMQGYAYQKPHGYSGDFEIIDKIYTHWTSKNLSFKKWDDFFHAQEAPIAVRNRKRYFIDLIQTRVNNAANVLNIGSGPARDIKEYFDLNKNSLVKFDCIELDENAIKYATDLCHKYMANINFINKNIFRFKSNKKYDLIWSAGLFDYFTDKQFIKLLQRLSRYITCNGMMVIGNFSNNNPSRLYMEKFGSWFLNHRSKNKLINLALESGIKSKSIEVHHEGKGVNLFLHIKST